MVDELFGIKLVLDIDVSLERMVGIMNRFEIDVERYERYKVMRQERPVFFNPETEIWEVYSYAECKQVLSQHEHFSSDIFTAIGRPEMQTLMTMDPKRHSIMRALILKAFTGRVVKEQAPVITNLANELIDKVVANGEMDIVKDMSFPVPATVIAVMLGIPKEDQTLFIEWASACLKVIEAAMGKQFADNNLVEKVNSMTSYLGALAKERRKIPKTDLITALTEAIVDGEKLSDEEIANTCKLLVNAGHDTTKLLISNMMYLLMQDQNFSKQILDDEVLFDAAIEEALRFTSPSQFFARIAKNDVSIGGQLVRSGQWVRVFLGAANRDDLVFENPDEFDIHRKNPVMHLGFGFGIHFCLGAPLGRLETKICVRTMLTRLHDLKINKRKLRRRIDAEVQCGFRNLPVTFSAA